jgi:DNA-binding MarR family transcriptional regulator
MAELSKSFPDPDKVIHERARLRILVYLSSSGESESGFTDIKKDLAMTSGNLSAQLGTLETAGYIAIQKSFQGKKPFTGVSLTPAGKLALERYLDEMESLLASLREGR